MPLQGHEQHNEQTDGSAGMPGGNFRRAEKPGPQEKRALFEVVNEQLFADGAEYLPVESKVREVYAAQHDYSQSEVNSYEFISFVLASSEVIPKENARDGCHVCQETDSRQNRAAKPDETRNALNNNQNHEPY